MIEMEISDNWVDEVGRVISDSHSWLSRIHRRVRNSDKGCSLTKEDLVLLALGSKGRCAVTGIPFSFETYEGAKLRPFSPSIDRIRCSDGYHLDNVRLVCLVVNVSLNAWGEAVLKRVGAAMLIRDIYGDSGL